MNVLFDKSFLKDIEKLKDQKLKTRVLSVIEACEQASSLHEIANLSKIKGHASAYRIRLGEYRIGLFIDNEAIKLIRFIHRKDIYNYFP